MIRLGLVLTLFAACGYENSQLRLRTAVDAQQQNLNACYEQTLATNPEASGQMKVVMHVSRGQGAIGDAQITASDVGDPELQQCVRSTLIGTPIGTAPINDSLDVEYTLAFRPE